jgi:hypothetical protein
MTPASWNLCRVVSRPGPREVSKNGHLDAARPAVIAAWIGHSAPTLTLRVYAHSQDDALKAAGASLDGLKKSSI